MENVMWFCIVVAVLLFYYVLNRVRTYQDTKQEAFDDKRDKVETQLDEIIDNYFETDEVDNETSNRKLDEAKELLMADWLETHPEDTRIDFTRHFDERFKLSCGSF
jgi:hypothetical protein